MNSTFKCRPLTGQNSRTTRCQFNGARACHCLNKSRTKKVVTCSLSRLDAKNRTVADKDGVICRANTSSGCCIARCLYNYLTAFNNKPAGPIGVGLHFQCAGTSFYQGKISCIVLVAQHAIGNGGVYTLCHIKHQGRIAVAIVADG